MAPPDAETEVRVSSEAAETFVGLYYQAINARGSLKQFYINSSARYSVPADISVNGKVLTAPDDYSALLNAQGPGVHYEIESLDAHVINPVSAYSAPENIHDNNKNEKNGSKMSIVVTAMGRVQFGKGKDAQVKMFNETFVLVPNWDSMAKNPPRGLKRWLIMSQNFRAL
ncbi:hypothetical protein HIM_05474 [Hirsutella minnesotensis 3608]|uniref:NTF2 domain-containing protein n=1 Tax=Hirsutella minnesotensis 3608 TaxID=1043627 RepID=A0A0F7ZUJ8_9HYPO|nr:hypothetical protein HIM_05474 [Hirsutella minnesotensis 3608]